MLFCTFVVSKEKGYLFGALAHLARAFDWQSRGGEFESRMLHELRSGQEAGLKNIKRVLLNAKAFAHTLFVFVSTKNRPDDFHKSSGRFFHFIGMKKIPRLCLWQRRGK
jgi:hypothetical protein